MFSWYYRVNGVIANTSFSSLKYIKNILRYICIFIGFRLDFYRFLERLEASHIEIIIKCFLNCRYPVKNFLNSGVGGGSGLV